MKSIPDYVIKLDAMQSTLLLLLLLLLRVGALDVPKQINNIEFETTSIAKPPLKKTRCGGLRSFHLCDCDVQSERTIVLPFGVEMKFHGKHEHMQYK